MKQLIIFLSLGFLILLGTSAANVKAETNIVHNKHEFRGVWVATVASIDIGYHITEDQYKEEFIKILDTVQEFNFNAIIFQVRPTNDAFYPSSLNPWSRYLTGIEGKSPGWDPLAWMVQESHKRGIEFHAWLNPYRISLEKVADNYDTKEDILNSLTDKNFAKKHPEYVLEGGDGRLILNPGEPAVKQFIKDTIEEIVTKYDVDAIHFDDYFYPYSGIKNSGDNETYLTYKNEDESLANWRRRNVDEVIQGISELIHTYDSENNQAVQFGISPFGVWKNKSSDPLGSDTRASESYNMQYADTRKWVKEEWLDYIAPQLYWEIGHNLADYETLSSWWADVVHGTKVNLYTGNAIYRYGSKNSDGSLNEAWNKYDELPKQLLMNNEHEEINGSIFFSYKHLRSASSSALITGRTYIQKRMWDTVALQPALPLINETIPSQIENVSTTTGSTNTSFDISWDKVANSKYYMVYRFEKDQTADLSDPANIYSLVTNDKRSDTVTFADTNLEADQEYVYHITVVSNGVKEGPAKIVNYKPTNDGDDTTTTEETTTTTSVDTTTTSENTTTTEQVNNNDDSDDSNKSLYVVAIVASALIVLGSISFAFRKIKRA